MYDMSTPKRIAITQRILEHNGFKYDAISQDWYAWLNQYSITAVKNQIDQNFDDIVDTHDVIIFGGGNTDRVRMYVELKLYDIAVAKNKPIIGVCHGFNFLTHVLGGSVTDIANHHNTTHDVVETKTDIVYKVNSFHTFTVDKLPNNVTVLATDIDGNCESFITGNVGGVMWHPERDPQMWLPDEIKQLLK